jgi:hypothetical protein
MGYMSSIWNRKRTQYKSPNMILIPLTLIINIVLLSIIILLSPMSFVFTGC